jgi:hypothetical protein
MRCNCGFESNKRQSIDWPDPGDFNSNDSYINNLADKYKSLTSGNAWINCYIIGVVLCPICGALYIFNNQNKVGKK